MIRLSTSLTPAQKSSSRFYNNVEQWLASNRLVLNQSKTKWMQKLEHCSYHRIQLYRKKIDRVSSFCYLGVILDENLSWNEHVELICNKVSKRLGLLSRIRPYLTLKAAKWVYNCLVQPIFDYTGTVWGGLSIGCSNSLQRLQNRPGSTHNTKDGNDRRISQNVRVGGFGNTKESPQMYFSFQMSKWISSSICVGLLY